MVFHKRKSYEVLLHYLFVNKLLNYFYLNNLVINLSQLYYSGYVRNDVKPIEKSNYMRWKIDTLGKCSAKRQWLDENFLTQPKSMHDIYLTNVLISIIFYIFNITSKNIGEG